MAEKYDFFKTLRINQLIRLRSNIHIEGFYLAKVKCLDAHLNKIGVEDIVNNRYKNYALSVFEKIYF